ncbi:uncharacterized protein [Triticum aestivum]|uniref:uncharacterized protein n=1 Tax=Triticum aestivum TaxID=4565 RepID=UPI001D00EF0B|nr:uncharacterized protein LOC123101631 [Triticum aestivum]
MPPPNTSVPWVTVRFSSGDQENARDGGIRKKLSYENTSNVTSHRGSEVVVAEAGKADTVMTEKEKVASGAKEGEVCVGEGRSEGLVHSSQKEEQVKKQMSRFKRRKREEGIGNQQGLGVVVGEKRQGMDMDVVEEEEDSQKRARTEEKMTQNHEAGLSEQLRKQK